MMRHLSSLQLFGGRFLEFFEDESDGLSMGRYMLYGSFVVSSAVMLLLTIDGKMSEGYFAAFLGAFSTVYLGGKAITNKTLRQDATPAVAPEEAKP